MDYKKMGSRVYIRMDKGDEILSCIRRVSLLRIGYKVGNVSGNWCLR